MDNRSLYAIILRDSKAGIIHSMKREFEVFNGKSGKLLLCTFYGSVHFMHATGI